MAPPAALAATLQARIDRELNLSASLGVATNKLIAKIASDFRKPHGITVVPRRRRSRVPRAHADPPAVGRGRGDGPRAGAAWASKRSAIWRAWPREDLIGRFGVASGEGLYRGKPRAG